MKAERKVFGRLQNTYDPPDLIEIQTKSYDEFLQEDVPAAKRAEQGLQAIFHEIFPIASYDGRYVLDFVKYDLGTPKWTYQQALYEAVFSATGDLPVTIRTLDIGGERSGRSKCVSRSKRIECRGRRRHGELQ